MMAHDFLKFEEEHEENLISQMSYYRNKLNYYGQEVPREFYENNKKEFGAIIDTLLEKIKKNI